MFFYFEKQGEYKNTIFIEKENFFRENQKCCFLTSQKLLSAKLKNRPIVSLICSIHIQSMLYSLSTLTIKIEIPTHLCLQIHNRLMQYLSNHRQASEAKRNVNTEKVECHCTPNTPTIPRNI